jgi:hypothetical protein
MGPFSKEMKEIGKTKVCPHCGKGIKMGLHQGRFALVFFSVAAIAILIGGSSPIAAGIAGGLGAVFGMCLKRA